MLNEKIFPLLYFSLMKMLRVGRIALSCTIKGCYKSIILERNVVVNAGALIQTGTTGSILIKNNSIVDTFAILRSHGGVINIGKEVSIGSFTYINGSGGVSVGDSTRIASHVSIISNNHVFDNVDLPIKDQGLEKKGIYISNNVWIGTGVRILDGVRIAEGAVIGAGSVINRDVPKNAVVVGVPGKVIKYRGK